MENDYGDIVSFETARSISQFLSTIREHQYVPRYDWAYDYDCNTETSSLNYYGGRVFNEGYDAYYLWDIVGWIQNHLNIHFWFEYIPRMSDDGYLIHNKIICHILPFINKPLYNYFIDKGLFEFEITETTEVNKMNDIVVRKIMDAYREQLEKEYEKEDEAYEKYETFKKLVKETI